MTETSNWKGRIFGKTLAATAVLCGFLLFAGAPGAAAHGPDKCYRRIARAERKLEKAIVRHGYYSRQAERRRYELRETRERCWLESSRRHRPHRGYDRDRDGDFD